MPPGLWCNSWASIANEVAYGTPVLSGEEYARIIRSTMGLEVNPKVYPGASCTERAMFHGNRVVGGDVEPEFHFGGHGNYLRHTFGGYSFQADTPVAGANTHTFTIGDLPIGFTMEDCKGAIPTDQVFQYAGCNVNQLALAFNEEEWLHFVFSLFAQEEVTGVARSGAPAYPADHPMLWHYLGQITLVGSVLDIMSGTFVLNNNLVRRFKSEQLTRQPYKGSRTQATGTVVAEFEDLTHYDKYAAGTEGALSMAWTSDEIITGTTPYSLTIAGAACHLEGTTPKAESEGPIPLPLNYRLLGATPVTATLVNADLTYA